jgi:hypothetical protein
MKAPGSGGLLLLVMAGCAGLTGTQAHAATPAFTITATNVTMPGGGLPGTSQFTLTSVNGYSGKLVVNSQFAGSDMNAKPPNCGIHAAPLFILNANSTVSGTLTCYPYGKVVPVVELHRPPSLPSRAPVLALAFAGWLVLRRRLRGTVARWLGVLLLVAISVAGLGACGGNGQSGSYPFTVTASDTVTQSSVSTSITVTVP